MVPFVPGSRDFQTVLSNDEYFQFSDVFLLRCEHGQDWKPSNWRSQARIAIVLEILYQKGSYSLFGVFKRSCDIEENVAETEQICELFSD